jgi:tetratricopeptide (TPR) repeat protein
MSHWILYLSLIVLIGSGLALDVPFVFDENSSDLDSYNSKQLEVASSSSRDLAGVPPVSSPDDYDTIEITLVANESINKSSTNNNSTQSQDILSGFEKNNQSFTDKATNFSHDTDSTEFLSRYILVKNPAELFNEGNKNYNKGNYQKAIECYDQAINLNPKLKEAWCNKGMALYRLEKYKDALKAFDQALIICPDYAKAWRCKGQAFEAMGLYDEAKQAFQNAG